MKGGSWNGPKLKKDILVDLARLAYWRFDVECFVVLKAKMKVQREWLSGMLHKHSLWVW